MVDVSFVAAFSAGLVTFFAPCTFVTLPAFISYLVLKASGESTQVRSNRYRWKVMISAIAYVSGFLIVFTLLGMTATSIGSLFSKNKQVLTQLGGVIIIFFGMFILVGDRLKPLHFLYREKKVSFSPQEVSKGYYFPFLIGITSAFAWTPCIGPILGSILLLASSTSSNAYDEGGLLLFTYGLGISIPFLLIALTFGYSEKFVRKFSKYTEKVYRFSAVLLILLGLSLVTGYSERIFSYMFSLFIKLGYNPV